MWTSSEYSPWVHWWWGTIARGSKTEAHSQQSLGVESLWETSIGSTDRGQGSALKPCTAVSMGVLCLAQLVLPVSWAGYEVSSKWYMSSNFGSCTVKALRPWRKAQTTVWPTEGGYWIVSLKVGLVVGDGSLEGCLWMLYLVLMFIFSLCPIHHDALFYPEPSAKMLDCVTRPKLPSWTLKLCHKTNPFFLKLAFSQQQNTETQSGAFLVREAVPAHSFFHCHDLWAPVAESHEPLSEALTFPTHPVSFVSY